ncbi:ACP S-malonyltransferase [Parvibaculum sp.]|jgi:[acyl-carrier-protein] S-malonyltransferase|uniref:ACP S-malonyltransferase n=1 Tax=Parvibaculum sp. TaxID=2024848 RepID=UPI000C5F9095|nr:ACP S-malonyltransferase [Parvibaculum sp.]MAM93551.1 [acyl-carrier-protein] S-malonyltransferase [Parvibaculum sp.]|tara:strand:- start:12849 stop:13790 length:942 start_codon:yes stop_codon:yes gene_type:complete
MTRAFIFPGQGSQSVGMGRELADAFASAREVFGEIDDALGQNLSKLMWEGPQEDLTLTENAQPAIMAVSLAVIRTLEKEGSFSLADKAAFVAGHSLGEYSALAAAGAFSVADTARLLKRRGQAMQRAVPVGEGAMAALLGLEFDQAAEVANEAAQGDVCTAANDNGGGQVVVSGTRAAVERAIEIAKTKGAKRSMLLPVSAPFHCPLMQPAADEMTEALGAVDLRAPSIPLVANVTASKVADPATIRDLLVKQVTGMVRWRESVLYMESQGVGSYVEVGAGKALSGMVKRIATEPEILAVGTPADVEAFLKTI